MIKTIFKELQNKPYEVEVLYFAQDNNTIITIGLGGAHITLYFKGVKPENCGSLGYVEIDGKHYGIYLYCAKLTNKTQNMSIFKATLTANKIYCLEDVFTQKEVIEMLINKTIY